MVGLLRRLLSAVHYDYGYGAPYVSAYPGVAEAPVVNQDQPENVQPENNARRLDPTAA